jgi:cytochrome c peroxidase
MSYIFAKDHLVEPTKVIALNRQLAMKEVYTSLPLDPGTGKVTCATCHNPHEKGVIKGRGDWGADSVRRLRSEGLEICQYCHRK